MNTDKLSTTSIVNGYLAGGVGTLNSSAGSHSRTVASLPMISRPTLLPFPIGVRAEAALDGGR